jgi:hypothetical protein
MVATFKPGEIVKISGIYSVVLEGGDSEGRKFDATCVEGDHFSSGWRVPLRHREGGGFAAWPSTLRSRGVQASQHIFAR